MLYDDDYSTSFSLFSSFILIYEDSPDFTVNDENNNEETTEMNSFLYQDSILIDFDLLRAQSCLNYHKNMHHKENYFNNFLDVVKMNNLTCKIFKEIKIRQNVFGSQKIPRVKFRANENQQILYLCQSKKRKKKKEEPIFLKNININE